MSDGYIAKIGLRHDLILRRHRANQRNLRLVEAEKWEPAICTRMHCNLWATADYSSLGHCAKVRCWGSLSFSLQAVVPKFESEEWMQLPREPNTTRETFVTDERDLVDESRVIDR